MPRISPTGVDSLPFELLLIIFLALRAYDPLNSPTIVTHVSRRWRAFALDSPSLWSEVQVSRKRHWAKCEAWIHRSQSQPLRITFQEGVFWRPAIKGLKRAMRLLMPHSARWLSLSIDGAPLKIIHILFNALRASPLPLLERLEILETKTSKGWNLLSLKHQIPNLRHLLLHPVIFTYSSGLFDNLHSLDIGDERISHWGVPPLPLPVAQVLGSILGRSPELRYLHIGNYAHIDDALPNTNQPTTTIPHSSLQILTLPTGVIEPFLEVARLPSLTRLWEAGRPRDFNFRPITLPILANWSMSCNLTSFTLNALFWGVNEDGLNHLAHLPVVLTMMVCLEVLKFESANFGEVWWPAVLSNVCPRLTTLSLNNCRGYKHEDLMTVLRGRMEMGEGFEPLRWLAIDGGRSNEALKPTVSEVEQLRTLVEVGIGF